MVNATIPTSEKRAKVLAALGQGLSIAAACRRGRIDRTTFYCWRNADEAFKDAAVAAIETGTDALEDALFRRAKRDDTTAAIFLLKARRPTMYRDTIRNEHTGADGAPMVVQFRERSDGPQ